MKILKPLILITFAAIQLLSAQSVGSEFSIQKDNKTIRPLHSQMDVDHVIAKLPQLLQLQEGTQMISISKEKDFIGLTHEKFQMSYSGYPVEGAQYIVHSRGQIFMNSNGKIPDAVYADLGINISASDAIQIAMGDRQANEYAWQNIELENRQKELVNNSKASLFPKPELVWVDFVTPGVFELCYKLDLFSTQPEAREWIYVHAANGVIIQKINQICTIQVEGLAKTKFAGTQKIIVDSLAADRFILKDDSRGKGVHTLNSKTASNFEDSEDFVDSDNYWNNVNGALDEVATDAHFGAEKTYDYFFQKYKRNSIDNNGFKIYSLVHYNSNWNNASWNGQTMNYGDGDRTTYHPFTLLDICGHEITHGVTSNTSNLVYLNESGALNESMSDIFGKHIKTWVFDTTANQWTLGTGLMKSDPNSGLRSFSDPNLYQCPKYYKGKYWIFGPEDNGGVHSNSGVLNYWFYLLTEGKKAKNEIGKTIDVAKIGMDKAAEIAYLMNSAYLTSRSNYDDAVEASMLAVEALYGQCSAEESAVQAAWYAVGLSQNSGKVYDVFAENNNSINSSCYLGANEKYTHVLRYENCNRVIPQGTIFYLGAKLDNATIWTDTMELNQDLKAGDRLEINVPVGIDLDKIGKHVLKVYHQFSNDGFLENDTAIISIEKYDPKNSDTQLKLASFGAINLGCEESGPLRGFFYTKYNGCDSLTTASPVSLGASINGEVVTGSMKVGKTIFRGDSSLSYFDLDLTKILPYTSLAVKVFLDQNKDANPFNDTLRVNLTRKRELTKDIVLDIFNTVKARDSLNIIPGLNANATVGNNRPIEGPASIRMSGGNINVEGERVDAPRDESEIWTKNQANRSRICICANAENMTHVTLQFDLKQNVIQTHEFYFKDYNHLLFSTLRVTVDGVQQSPNLFLASKEDTLKVFRKEVGLDAFAGKEFEFCFENFAILEQNYDPLRIGDATWIDNIVLKDQVLASKDISTDEFQANIIYDGKDGLPKLYLENAQEGQIYIALHDILGRSVGSLKLGIHAGDRILDLPIEKLVPGLYSCTVRNDSGRIKSLLFYR